MAFFEVVPVVPILAYCGVALGITSVALELLAHIGRFEPRRPAIQRWAGRLAITSLVLLAVLVA